MQIKMLLLITILTLLISSLFLVCYLMINSKKEYYKGPLSNHFNGTVFFNPGSPDTQQSRPSVFRWWLNRDKQPWPEHVINPPHAPVTPVTQAHTVKVTFINHATVLLQTQHYNLLTDPTWSKRASPFSWVGPKRVRDPGLAFSELPRIDAVLISHNHYDHLDTATLMKLDNTFHPVFLVPLGDKLLLKNLGIKNVIELDWWQQYTAPYARITFMPSQHWSARWLNDRNRTLWGSYGIEIADKKIYFAGDTGFGDHFKTIREKWHQPDFALLPIGAYQPEWFMHNHHMNPEEAVKAHIDLQSAKSMGIHFGTFQLSDEAIDQPTKDLTVALKKHLLTSNDFFVLQEGNTTALP